MVKKAVDAAAILTPKKSFAVRARRAGEHDFTSMDIQRIVGAEIKKKTGAKVDLKNPDVCIYIEAREKKSFIYTSIIRGFGGLPVGSQERVLSIMNDEKSILSTWYALRRGCDVDVLLSEQMDVHDILLPWACYRKIGLHLSKGNMKDLLCKAFETDYPAVYCSATFEEAENLISTSLLKKRRMPVFTPLLSLKEEEIQKKIQIIKSYFNCKKRSM
jgi:thiamine biosynthesis protein ThiI